MAISSKDPTVGTRAWTLKQEFTRQSEQQNRIYYEPRCIEGNASLPAMLLAARQADIAFAAGRAPDPAKTDNVSTLVDIDTSVVRDQ